MKPWAARDPDVIDAEHVLQRAAMQRDAGLRRIGKVTRWLMAAALGLTGALALFAASAFHGHSVAASPSNASTASQSASTSSGPQSPAQAPQPAVSAPVVVSGGS